MVTGDDDSLHPTDRWARRVRADDGPQDSPGRSLLVDADTVAVTRDPELDDLLGAPSREGAQPATIGKYRLGAALGGGGMGEVFLATDTRLGRKAAIKLLRSRGRDDPHEHDRLLREAQALAALSDPNVVGVFDCGVHDGRVFLAMEYVEGATLRDWQDASPRTWQQVLAHYLAAGRGLAAIHAAGLVHRDFKPQNVLVSRHGQVKITDFGLAVAPGERARPPAAPEDRAALHHLLATQLTATAAVMGTPLYISPEQLSAGPVDPRSDQFSFCVAIYEALYGGHPYAAPDPSALSQEQTPTRFSRGAVGTEPSGPPSMMSLVTGLIDGPLRRPPKIVIPGRVFRAIERGLSRDPSARYPSMEALLADLARDPLRKYGPTAAVATFSFAVGAALFVPPLLGICKDIESEFDAAWSTARADAVARAFVDSGSPHAAPMTALVRRTLDDYRAQWIAARTENCEATQARRVQNRELHDRRHACLDQARDTVAAAVDQLTRADADVVVTIADALALLPPLEQCSAEFQARQTCLDGADDPALRARLEAIRALEFAGKLRDAGAGADALLADLGEHPRLAAETQLLRGRVFAEQGRAAAAYAAFAAAHDMSERAGCDAHAFEAATRRTKLVALHRELPAERGLGWSEVARAKLLRLPPSDRLAAAYHSDLGLLYQHRDDLADPQDERRARARAEHEQALALRQKLAGDDPSPDLAISHLNLGAQLAGDGELDRALEHVRRSLALYTAVHGADHPALWRPHRQLGNVLLELERLPEARTELQRAIDLAGAGLGEQHREVGILQYTLATSYADDDPARALALGTSALTIYEREVSERDPQRADPLVLLGALHAARDEPADALRYLEQALRRQRHADPAERARTHLDLAATLRDLGRIEEARAQLRRATALLDDLDEAPADLTSDIRTLIDELLRPPAKKTNL